ncbi:hypothetical protein AXG93_2175s1080 [Marchantia polymorpha subsp. ruderalis]|uniref:Uncharacterized protein n=1 Tax=Marchantia polymorpha subsp. ruderalis TaxID=1480154 RepID=A0A176W7Z0_MARPO|nr:hypothetical protein AXG93_2175s1080 [Marchantia polymorpha subsp. ruderalis]
MSAAGFRPHALGGPDVVADLDLVRCPSAARRALGERAMSFGPHPARISAATRSRSRGDARGPPARPASAALPPGRSEPVPASLRHGVGHVADFGTVEATDLSLTDNPGSPPSRTAPSWACDSPTALTELSHRRVALRRPPLASECHFGSQAGAPEAPTERLYPVFRLSKTGCPGASPVTRSVAMPGPQREAGGWGRFERCLQSQDCVVPATPSDAGAHDALDVVLCSGGGTW